MYVSTQHWVKLGDELIKTTFRHDKRYPIFLLHITTFVGKSLQKSDGKSSRKTPHLLLFYKYYQKLGRGDQH